MSNRACCVKIKECGRLLQGVGESQMFLLETMNGVEIPEKLEHRLVTFWDKAIAEAKQLRSDLFEISANNQ